MMFGQKKATLPEILTAHYEGVNFPANIPCGLEWDETITWM